MTEVNVYARVTGQVEFLCPHCTRMQKTQVDWRRPRFRCRNNSCTRTTEFGLLAELPGEGEPVPFNGRSALADQYSSCNNHTHVVGEAWVARVVGTLEFWCLACGERNCGAPDVFGNTVCRDCADIRKWGLIVYETVAGAHIATPRDWIPPDGTEVSNQYDRGRTAKSDSGRDRGAQRTVQAGHQAA